MGDKRSVNRFSEGRKMLQIVLLLALVASSTACSESDVAQIRSCYQTYMAGFNITMTNALPAYFSFHDIRMDWLNAQGIAAQPPICQLGNNLIQCLSSYTCMNTETYFKLGASNQTEANDYWIDLAVTQYQCGPGYNLLMQNFDCLNDCRAKHEKELDACSAQFEINIPLKGFCKAEQTFLNCQMYIFQDYCNWNSGVFFCGTTLAGINAMDPKCYQEKKVSCPNARNFASMLKSYNRVLGVF